MLRKPAQLTCDDRLKGNEPRLVLEITTRYEMQVRLVLKSEGRRNNIVARFLSLFDTDNEVAPNILIYIGYKIRY